MSAQVVGRDGFEPSSVWLRASNSAVELAAEMAGKQGVEPRTRSASTSRSTAELHPGKLGEPYRLATARSKAVQGVMVTLPGLEPGLFTLRA